MADDLTERVARAIDSYAWDDTFWTDNFRQTRDMRRRQSLESARAALAVVADDVDGLAGVLRDHQKGSSYFLNNTEMVVACVGPCTWQATVRGGDSRELFRAVDEAVRHHQAAMLAAHIRGKENK